MGLIGLTQGSSLKEEPFFCALKLSTKGIIESSDKLLIVFFISKEFSSNNLISGDKEPKFSFFAKKSIKNFNISIYILYDEPFVK